MEQHGFESRTCGCLIPVLIVNWMIQQIEFKFELSLSLIFGDFIKHLEHGHIKNGYQMQATHWKADLTNIVDVVLKLPRTKAAEWLWIPLKKVTDKIQKKVTIHEVCCKLREDFMHNKFSPLPPKVLGVFPCETYNNKNYQSVDQMAWLLPHMSWQQYCRILICLKFECNAQDQLTGLYSRNQMENFPLWLVKQPCIYVCARMCIYLYIYIHIHTYTHTHIYKTLTIGVSHLLLTLPHLWEVLHNSIWQIFQAFEFDLQRL